MKRLTEILFKSDLALAALLTGFGMFGWGLITIYTDVLAGVVLSKDYHEMFWILNYTISGFCFMCLAYADFPPKRSLITGAYTIGIWSYSIGSQHIPDINPGTVLDAIVIFIGVLLLQRSNVK